MAITPSQWSHVLTIPESYTPAAATSGQTLVITESVVAKLSVLDQTTFWSNVQNGGGDVRICTDSAGTNQLPVEIVSLDNVAQTCVIWTRKASYDGTGDLYVFIGKTGETQPAVTDPFGRNAVWVDYEAVLHLSEDVTSGIYSDSTGNGYDTTLTTGATLSNTSAQNPFGLKWPDFTGNEILTLAESATILNGVNEFTLQCLMSAGVTSNIDGVFGNRRAGADNEWAQLMAHEQVFVKSGSEDFAGGSGLATGVALWRTLAFDSASLQGITNGTVTTQDTSISSSLPFSTGDDWWVGGYFNADTDPARRYNGAVGELRVRLEKLSPDFLTTEYNNQNDPASFYGTPALADTGGAATPVSADVDYAVPSPTFTSAASVTLPAPIADTSFTVTAPTFSATGAASLPQPTANASFTVLATTFAATADATIPGFNASVSFTADAPTFSGAASVTLPNPTADVDYTINAPTFSVDADASLPQPTAEVAFSVNSPQFAASATATEPGFNASVNFTVNAPTFSGDASVTLPQPDADVNFTVSAPTFSVVAIVGGIAIIVDDETNITLQAQSTNIDLPALSNNLEI